MSSQGKKERIEIRLPSEAKRQIEYAARLQGRSVSDFVAAAALVEAERVIEQQKTIKLSIEDSEALAQFFLDTPKRNSKAITAARRYQRRMRSRDEQAKRLAERFSLDVSSLID